MRDWAVAVLAVAVTAIQVSVGPTPQPHPAVSVGAGFSALGGALAPAWRRIAPGPAVAVAVVGLGLHDVLVGPAPPLAGWFAVIAIARHARTLPGALRGATLAAGALAGAEFAAGLIHDRLGSVSLAVMLTLIVLLVASLVRLQADRVAGERRERDAARQQAVTDERLRIARDLHDLVGHGLSTVAIQSSTARVALDSGDPAAARRAVASIEAASRAALAVGVVLGWVFIVECILPSVFGEPGLGRWLPAGVADSTLSIGLPSDPSQLMPAVALVVLIGYALGLVVAGTARAQLTDPSGAP